MNKCYFCEEYKSNLAKVHKRDSTEVFICSHCAFIIGVLSGIGYFDRENAKTS